MQVTQIDEVKYMSSKSKSRIFMKISHWIVWYYERSM